MPHHSESASSEERCKVKRQEMSVYFLIYFECAQQKILTVSYKELYMSQKCLCPEMFKLYKGFFEMTTSVLGD